MKVLIGLYSDIAKAGGAEGILRQLTEYYLDKGNDVYVLIQNRKRYGEWECKGYNNLHLYYGGGILQRFKNVWRLRRTIFDYSFSSIVRVTGPMGLMKRTGLLHIRTMVGRESTSIFARYRGWRLRYYQLWYKLGYEAVDVLICQTSFMKHQLLEHLPWLEKHSRVTVIPNPVNISTMEEKGREEIEVSALKPYVVTAGRFISEKAYDVLVDAFSCMVKKRPEMKLVILGDGTLRGQIESQVERLGMRDRVVLQGQVENVYPWFREAVLCVVSSRMEGFPNVLLQMMSQNERVVSTLCAGDIDKIDGLTTCCTDDANALAEAMLITLNKDVSDNREKFDNELKSRSIEKFIGRIESISKY